MCGIAGIYRLDGMPVDAAELESLMAPLEHRGPDGSGRYIDGPLALGHWRLSILDPSPEGAQPMHGHGIWIIHNGEIYNFLELAAELRTKGYRFATGTDTEVIIAAYAEWGLDAFARLNGMWAVALWDAPRARLVLSRDRFGVKPLFLRQSGNEVVFASEMGPFLRYRGGPGATWAPEPNTAAVRDFLGRGLTDHSTETFFSGITTIPAGHLVVLEAGDTRRIRYWNTPALADDARPMAQGVDARRDEGLVEEFRALFDDAVRLRLRADVPIGSCLSGGLDSSSIVATFSRLLGKTSDGALGHVGERERVPRFAFHARFPGQVDESSYAEMAGDDAGLAMVYASPRMESPTETITPVLAAQGEPFAGSSMYAQYAVMRAAHQQGLKVLLDGQGGDEVCGGYLPYLGVRAASLVRAGMPAHAATELRHQVRRGSLSPEQAVRGLVRGILPDGVNEHLRRAALGRYGVRLGDELRQVETLRHEHRVPGTLLARRLWQEITSDSLPALLRYEDRNSMAFAIETRVPFLDYRLVELAVRLPDRLRVDRGVTKVVLRRAMTGRVPAAILDRRDKIGFATPQRFWLGAGMAHIASRVRSGQVVQRGWIAPEEVERLIADATNADTVGSQLWRVFIVEEWLRAIWPGASRG